MSGAGKVESHFLYTQLFSIVIYLAVILGNSHCIQFETICMTVAAS